MGTEKGEVWRFCGEAGPGLDSTSPFHKMSKGAGALGMVQRNMIVGLLPVDSSEDSLSVTGVRNLWYILSR